MQKDPSRNKYICIINEQTNNCVPNPYDKGTETKYKVIMGKPK